MTDAEAIKVAIDVFRYFGKFSDRYPDNQMYLQAKEAAARLERLATFVEACMEYCERAETFDHDAGLMDDMRAAYRALSTEETTKP